MNAEQLVKFFHGGNNYLMENKSAVDALNVFPVPDGDTGTNMSLTLQAAVKELRLDETDMAKIADIVARGSLMGARGNSGVILSQLFRGFAQGLNGTEVTSDQLAEALQKAVNMAYKAVMRPVEGTILTVAKACAEGAKKAAKEGSNSLEVMEIAVQCGETALAKTPEQLPVLKEAGVVDAGGQGLLVIFKGGIKAIKGEEMLELEIQQPVVDAQPKLEVEAASNADLEFKYCTEFIIKGQQLDGAAFRSSLETLGDSLMAVGTDIMLKVHIHTNNPGKVLQLAVALGTLHDIKIDNMEEQHRSYLEQELNERDSKNLGIVSVAVGEGLSDLLINLGVDKVVSGGQTMNPSTEDLIEAINNVPAENVIVLPNNSNIILAAQQAKRLAGKRVEVIPTKTYPQGVAALLALNPEAAIEENCQSMGEAVDLIISGEVTYAVRETSFNGFKIDQGDILGIKDGDIEVVGSAVNQVILELLDKMVDEKSELLTLYFGQEIDESEAEQLKNIIDSRFSQLETELYNGGQPIYYYLISLE